MKTPNRAPRTGAFTLIEMVGVLAVIAILAGLLMPRIFSAVNEARLNNAVSSCNTIKSAATTYFAKYGKFGGVEGETITTNLFTTWDTAVLMVEGLIDKPFGPRLGDTATVQVADTVAAGTDAAADNTAYNLDNNITINKNDAIGAKVVECVFSNISREDAWEMSWRIDGPTFTAGNKTDQTDVLGRVKYNIPGTLGTVRVYVAHK
jgi:type II secretory pathway pseudopilin PulG